MCAPRGRGGARGGSGAGAGVALAALAGAVDGAGYVGRAVSRGPDVEGQRARAQEQWQLSYPRRAWRQPEREDQRYKRQLDETK